VSVKISSEGACVSVKIAAVHTGQFCEMDVGRIGLVSGLDPHILAGVPCRD
jgi:hypothetical protein